MEKDEYFVYLERDFCLGMIEINGIESDLDKKPWIKEKSPYYPYCYFWRKNNMVLYMFSKKGTEWVKEQINKRNIENPLYYRYIIERIEEEIKPIWNILNEEKTLSLSELKKFCITSKKVWDWFEAHWWNIYLFEEQKKSKELKYLLIERKKYANFAPGINIVIRKSLLKAYPKYENYIDVISLEEAFSGKIPPENILKERMKEYFYVDHKLIINEDIKFIEEKYNLFIEKNEIDDNQKEMTGTSAYPGKVKGRVRIISKTSEMNKMKEGEILVSPTTLPELMPAIRKASAIIANEGGMLSHASIVSREMKIPCIVGTKIATQVLHDGDFVEVNADEGIVRVLERNESTINMLASEEVLKKDWLSKEDEAAWKDL